ncbi:MAG TPA: hypothetical protein VFQ61_22535, partial [Polyangiaceae bacterium]|nr:hypothetical protein [Polyangiaceae bacterium]
MLALSRWIGVGAATGILLALVPVVRGSFGPLNEPLRKIMRPNVFVEPPKPPDFSGLDLLRLELRPQRAIAPLTEGRMAELTIDPVLQRAARSQMQHYRIPEAGTVMLDV